MDDLQASRGGWASTNDAVFKALGLRALTKAQFITKAILSTLDLMRTHNDFQTCCFLNGPKHLGHWEGHRGDPICLSAVDKSVTRESSVRIDLEVGVRGDA